MWGVGGTLDVVSRAPLFLIMLTRMQHGTMTGLPPTPRCPSLTTTSRERINPNAGDNNKGF